MAGKTPVKVAQDRRRGRVASRPEADRARAILVALAGRTSAESGEAFGRSKLCEQRFRTVREETVRAPGAPLSWGDRTAPRSRLPAGRRSRRRARQPALAARRPWRPERPAKGAPERNDLAPEWKTLKADPLAHRTFQNRDSLKATIDADIQAINSSRKSQPLANQRISAWRAKPASTNRRDAPAPPSR